MESMQEFYDFFLNSNGVAFGVALVIFIITLWLVVRRLIGFVFTIILLIFALVSGFFVANADLFRELVKGLAPSSTPEEKETVVQLKNQLYKAFLEVKGEIIDQKDELQKILERAKAKDELAKKEEALKIEEYKIKERKEELKREIIKQEEITRAKLRQEQLLKEKIKDVQRENQEIREIKKDDTRLDDLKSQLKKTENKTDEIQKNLRKEDADSVQKANPFIFNVPKNYPMH